ncbi:hypothetical protein K0504_03115 [Neiella marina]|uniref:Uncharacterized protein n=1 Tax=Neiella holothuriorum TaxID=2870530 RepID=A0ABS7EDK7_9GAMM|nr:hypothetical protein [Neiella holothuriorum]MBW8190013.1 hypothetical protein [Neiella holothuriorum]
MKRKLAWISSSVSALVVTVAIGASMVYQSQAANTAGLMACDCESGVSYDNALPSSHPTNQCAIAASNPSTSWYGWAIGSSRSTSFHFLDLLELLSRDSNKSIQSDKKPTGESR